MTEQSDMVLFLINFPDLIVGMLMGSAVSALLVPQFVQSESEEDKRKLYSRAAGTGSLWGFYLYSHYYFLKGADSITGSGI